MTPEQRNTAADLLLQWEDLYRKGQDTPVDVLCKDHPELAETLARHIAALKKVAWLDKGLEDEDDDDVPEARPDDPRPPKVLIGRYRLDELIATGGFAEVWRAFDQELQRTVAVKIPKRTVVGSAESFLAEARRVARLRHPGILPVYDVGVEDGDCFFISEFIEGGSLADRLIKGKLPAEQVCRWIASIAEALDHAHKNGVIHRDVKPANILIDNHDRALLADFGIAQSSMKTGQFAPSLGTLRYMAPEQLNGQSALPQSDIYSLGVVLHEALTGKPPYSSDQPNTLRTEIHSGASVSRNLPECLAPICRKALQQDPGQRFGTAAEFATAIRNAVLKKPRLRKALLPITVAVLGVIGTIAYTNTQKQRPDSLAVAEDVPGGRKETNGFLYKVEPEGSKIVRYVGSDPTVVIPDTIAKRPVVAIEPDAFNGRHEVNEVILPKTILCIGPAAFVGCSIQSIELPPSLEAIGFNAFQFTPLKTVSIPASVHSLGPSCFSGCRQLEAINVDAGNRRYTSVDGVLYDKDVATLITCPQGKQGVLEIPATVSTIKSWSFANCTKLDQIMIPSSVTTIEDKAFEACDAKQIRVSSTPPPAP